MNLSELITIRRAALGLTLREVARRCAEAGNPVSAGTVHRLENMAELRQIPDGNTLDGLAKALKEKPQVVARCALKSIGIDLGEILAATADGVIKFEISGHGLDNAQRERLLRVATEAVRREHQAIVRSAERNAPGAGGVR